MRGLRTQESEKFNRFFAVVQTEAKKQNAVFFADAGDGNDFATPTMEGENIMGWLIPTDKVEEFEPLWMKDEADDVWTDFFVWAIWSMDGDTVSIRFEE